MAGFGSVAIGIRGCVESVTEWAFDSIFLLLSSWPINPPSVYEDDDVSEDRRSARHGNLGTPLSGLRSTKRRRQVRSTRTFQCKVDAARKIQPRIDLGARTIYFALVQPRWNNALSFVFTSIPAFASA
jgi:hypothetical protein